MAQLNKLLVDVLDSYNEVNAVMNLVSGARPDSAGEGLHAAPHPPSPRHGGSGPHGPWWTLPGTVGWARGAAGRGRRVPGGRRLTCPAAAGAV